MEEDDRRRYKRRRKQSVIKYYVTAENGRSEMQEGLVVDCSHGGVRFTAQKPIEKNNHIHMKLSSDDWGEELSVFYIDTEHDFVEILGTVMWCLSKDSNQDEFEVGARFTGQPDA